MLFPIEKNLKKLSSKDDLDQGKNDYSTKKKGEIMKGQPNYRALIEIEKIK